jgi:peroxiredoxin
VACASLANEPQSAAGHTPLELDLISSDGRSLQLSALRGRPTLLFLFATYDPSSQLALAGLLREIEREPRLTVLGVAVQPDAQLFLEPFRETLEIPFPLYIDRESALLRGDTPLGKIPGIPAFVALDAEGHVRRTHFGVADRDALETLVESAL